MVVISDTSPLNYLILIGAASSLSKLFGQVVAPYAVLRELRNPGAPHEVLQWVANPPEWLLIERDPPPSDGALARLGAGARAAIGPAEMETRPVLLLIDEIQGTAGAARRGFATTGTLGVLDAAAEAGFLNLPGVIARLRATTFHATPQLIKRLLDRVAARNRPNPPRNP